ncbi:MAG: four helix bundle protein [candidate division SR1 bacterium]|nr:four helix bundle protein [candidate division SR1 bacterium]
MRAAISVSNNIAEGRERGTNKWFTQFLAFAKGSIGEVRSMLYTALDLGYITDTQFEDFHSACKELSVKIYRFIQSLY